MLIAGFPAGPFQTNCWLLAPGPGEQCIVVDPGLGVEPGLDELLAEHRLQPVAVVLTHGHLDHTFSVVPVCAAKDVPAYIHPADRAQLSDPLSWSGPGVAEMFAGLTFAEPSDLRTLEDGAILELAGLSLRVDHAPGHTRGSITLRVGEGLVSGDLLFAGSIGRTDLPGGDHLQMLDSLRRVVLPLQDETVVWPGHGPTTTIGRERSTNPFLLDLGPGGLG